MFYQLRRLLLSCSLEVALRLFAWQQRLQRVFLPLYLFIIALIPIGLAFLLAPQTMIAYLGFPELAPVALADVRAFYGAAMIGLALALLVCCSQPRMAAAGLLVTAGFSLGSAAGRIIALFAGLDLFTIHTLLLPGELFLGGWALMAFGQYRRASQAAVPIPRVPRNPQRPEDLDPTASGTIEQPYEYYRLLRDQRPLYQPAGQDFYCLSRYADIQQVARNTEVYSSNIVNVLMDKQFGGRASARSVRDPGTGSRRNLGVAPVDVLAIQDPPAHKYQKLLTHKILSADFVRGLEADVQRMASEIFSGFVSDGQVEFMQAVAWPLPMRMAMRLVGFPEADYERVKRGCADAIKLVSSVSTAGEFARYSAGSLSLVRYCWKHYLKAKRDPQDNITGGLARAAQDPQHPLTDEEAVSIILQLLIAGSDSSASTMGNAVRLLIEHPVLQQRLRKQPERIADFIEEVLRLESAFQGHFRILKEDVELHGQALPRGTRLFLLWASGNRDERFWERPDALDIDRPNLKKHLTFGYGIHACLGRELARMEIRIVLVELLRRTRNLYIAGDTPHVASLFTRTLVQLPISFDPVDVGVAAPTAAASTGGGHCPFVGATHSPAA